MNIEEIRNYCISKKGVSESFPFDNETLVFKVGSKMFALLTLEGEKRINLKCLPDKAVELREQYSFIIPGYHMNKQHWNTILLEKSNNKNLITQLIDNSYELVFTKLTKKEKEEINNI